MHFFDTITGMNPRRILLLATVSLLLAAIPRETQAASKIVMVYYMPWFSAKPDSQTWGWHWTMDRFNPDTTNTLGQRQIASWYYPLIGPYDSSDDAVLEYHVLLMKLAGIDGVIVDWYGSADYLDYGINNRATMKLFGFTRKAGLKFAVCYEDQTIQHLIDGNFLSASNAIFLARQEMQYLETNWFSEPRVICGWVAIIGAVEFPGPQYFTASTNGGTPFFPCSRPRTGRLFSTRTIPS